MTEEIEKAGKGPEKPQPKGARGYKITEEPATRSSTHQNYKSYPNRADFGKGEEVTAEDMANLRKSLGSLTQVVKDMTEMLDKAHEGKAWNKHPHQYKKEGLKVIRQMRSYKQGTDQGYNKHEAAAGLKRMTE